MVWARSNNPSILRLAIGSKLASTKGSSGTHQRGGSEWVVRTRCDALKRYGELPTYCGYSLQQYLTYLTFSFFHHPDNFFININDFGEHKSPARSSPDG